MHTLQLAHVLGDGVIGAKASELELMHILSCVSPSPSPFCLLTLSLFLRAIIECVRPPPCSTETGVLLYTHTHTHTTISHTHPITAVPLHQHTKKSHKKTGAVCGGAKKVCLNLVQLELSSFVACSRY